MRRAETGRTGRIAVATGLVLLVLAGCRVEQSGKDNNEKFRVATPFGGLQVKTNEAVVAGGVGLPVYPGATSIKKEGDKDDGAADIDLTLGDMHLRVKALSYRTGDSPTAVRAFYGKELGRYGVVITCVNDQAVGEPTRTPEGLTCDKERNGSAAAALSDKASTELKAGSPQHQHIAAIEPEGSGTKIGLVVLDLPRKLASAMQDDDSK